MTQNQGASYVQDDQELMIFSRLCRSDLATSYTSKCNYALAGSIEHLLHLDAVCCAEDANLQVRFVW